MAQQVGDVIEPDSPIEHIEILSPAETDHIDVTKQLEDEDIESALAEFDAALEDLHL